jgi:hypothetical protein
MDTILNPTTGRLIKKTSVLGKKIAKGYIPPVKPCKAGNIKNPKTLRCVKETGSIGRKIKRETGLETKPSIPIALPLPTISQMKNEIIPEIIPPSMILAPPPPRPSNLPPSVIFQLKRLDKIQQIKEEKQATNTIQAIIKRRLTKTDNANKKMAARTLQAAIKRKLDLNKNKAAKTLQAAIKRKLEDKTSFEDVDEYILDNDMIDRNKETINAAKKLQSYVKFKNIRNNYLSKLNVERFRKNMRDYNELRDNNAAIKIQSLVRQVNAKKIASNVKKIKLEEKKYQDIKDFINKLKTGVQKGLIVSTALLAANNIISSFDLGNLVYNNDMNNLIDNLIII